MEAGRAPLPRAVGCDVVKITFALAALLTVLLNFAVVGQFGGGREFRESCFFFLASKRTSFFFENIFLSPSVLMDGDWCTRERR